MGSRGPTKKPATLHKRNGTYRPGKHGGPALKVQVPDAPPDISPIAAAQWAVIGRELADAGLISGVDRTVFRMLCESIAVYLEAMDELREHGLVIKAGKNDYLMPNPAVSIRNTAWVQIVAACKQFGMTPSSRTGLKVESKQDDDDVSGILGLRVVS